MTIVYTTNSGKVVASAPLSIRGVQVSINGHPIAPAIAPPDIDDSETFTDQPQWWRVIESTVIREIDSALSN